MTSDEIENIEEDDSGTSEANLLNRPLNEEMKNSYINYAMSVIIGRALPDARDGLKPVHRRVLYGTKVVTLLKRNSVNLLAPLEKSWVSITHTEINQSTTLWSEWHRNSPYAIRW